MTHEPPVEEQATEQAFDDCSHLAASLMMQVYSTFDVDGQGRVDWRRMVFMLRVAVNAQVCTRTDYAIETPFQHAVCNTKRPFYTSTMSVLRRSWGGGAPADLYF